MYYKESWNDTSLTKDDKILPKMVWSCEKKINKDPVKRVDHMDKLR